MTRLEFIAMCGEYLVDPGIALENENIVEALQSKNDDEVERLLREES